MVPRELPPRARGRGRGAKPLRRRTAGARVLPRRGGLGPGGSPQDPRGARTRGRPRPRGRYADALAGRGRAPAALDGQATALLDRLVASRRGERAALLPGGPRPAGRPDRRAAAVRLRMPPPGRSAEQASRHPDRRISLQPVPPGEAERLHPARSRRARGAIGRRGAQRRGSHGRGPRGHRRGSLHDAVRLRGPSGIRRRAERGLCPGDLREAALRRTPSDRQPRPRRRGVPARAASLARRRRRPAERALARRVDRALRPRIDLARQDPPLPQRRLPRAGADGAAGGRCRRPRSGASSPEPGGGGKKARPGLAA